MKSWCWLYEIKIFHNIKPIPFSSQAINAKKKNPYITAMEMRQKTVLPPKKKKDKCDKKGWFSNYMGGTNLIYFLYSCHKNMERG
jgi:hypothetical protein